MPTQAPPAAEEAPAPDPNLPPEPEVAAAEALTLSSDVITTTATPSLPTVTSTATQELTAALELAPLAISETVGADVAAASALSTTSGTVDPRITESQFVIAETPTPTATVTLTPALSGELDTRRTLTESATATSVPIDLNDATVAAAAASNVAPTGENPTATPAPEQKHPRRQPRPQNRSLPWRLNQHWRCRQTYLCPHQNQRHCRHLRPCHRRPPRRPR